MNGSSPSRFFCGEDVGNHVCGVETLVHIYLFSVTLGTRKEEVNPNNREKKIFLIPFTVDA